MNSISDAINTLITAVNAAQQKGVYTIEDSHHIYTAITFIEEISKKESEKNNEQS